MHFRTPGTQSPGCSPCSTHTSAVPCATVMSATFVFFRQARSSEINPDTAMYPPSSSRPPPPPCIKISHNVTIRSWRGRRRSPGWEALGPTPSLQAPTRSLRALTSRVRVLMPRLWAPTPRSRALPTTTKLKHPTSLWSQTPMPSRQTQRGAPQNRNRRCLSRRPPSSTRCVWRQFGVVGYERGGHVTRQCYGEG